MRARPVRQSHRPFGFLVSLISVSKLSVPIPLNFLSFTSDHEKMQGALTEQEPAGREVAASRKISRMWR